ncbi:MAG: hypothetical protein JJV93_02520 [Alphaproteobacteria bacterium]|nr:hypothetical protein [Alphaproteobacteria bacterium]MBL0718106.1 hypothetical protein [Alphaproteobacteria bacterium]
MNLPDHSNTNDFSIMDIMSKIKKKLNNPVKRREMLSNPMMTEDSPVKSNYMEDRETPRKDFLTKRTEVDDIQNITDSKKTEDYESQQEVVSQEDNNKVVQLHPSKIISTVYFLTNDMINRLSAQVARDISIAYKIPFAKKFIFDLIRESMQKNLQLLRKSGNRNLKN